MSMPNVGADADFVRRDAVDQMLQFMRDAELTGAPFNLKEMIEDVAPDNEGTKQGQAVNCPVGYKSPITHESTCDHSIL